MQKLLDDLAQTLREILERLNRVDASLRKLTDAQPPQEFYTIRELSKLLRLSPETVRQHCRNGRIVAQRTNTGRGNKREYRVAAQEVRRFQQEGLLPGKDRPLVDKPR